MFEIDAIANNDRQKKSEFRVTQPLYEHLPLVLPKGATWNGISIEHHRQPPAECELRLPQHTMCILLSPCHTERCIDGERIHNNHAEQGEVIIYPAHSQHWIRWQEEAEFLLLFLDPSCVTQNQENAGDTNAIEIMESEKEFQDPLVQQIGLALKAELDAGMASSATLYAESLAVALSAHLQRHYAVQKHATNDIPIRSENITMRRVTEYIHDNLHHQLTLAELSFIANMSAYHFARTFKQATGLAPHQYVLRTRIECAKGLLLQGRLPISEIATRVGFFDQSHFTRYFKRVVGVTPQALLREKGKILP
ncbi:MAG: AraC family transcriptional regulator [Ktedonobacteraceae bacterium]